MTVVQSVEIFKVPYSDTPGLRCPQVLTNCFSADFGLFFCLTLSPGQRVIILAFPLVNIPPLRQGGTGKEDLPRSYVTPRNLGVVYMYVYTGIF